MSQSMQTPSCAGFDAGPLRHAARWQPAEYAFWLLPIAAYFVFPEDLSLLSQIVITALFALSLDLILGYAGIVSLGHAAFFGVGAYAAGLLAQHGWSDPVLGLLGAGLIAGLIGFMTSFLVLRGADLTRLMVTLGVSLMLFEAANKLTHITGGMDGLQGVEMNRCWACLRSICMARRLIFIASLSCSCCSGWPGASCIRLSACRCAASAKTCFACLRWARRSMRA